jgi:hypothetical protein
VNHPLGIRLFFSYWLVLRNVSRRRELNGEREATSTLRKDITVEAKRLDNAKDSFSLGGFIMIHLTRSKLGNLNESPSHSDPPRQHPPARSKTNPLGCDEIHEQRAPSAVAK